MRVVIVGEPMHNNEVGEAPRWWLLWLLLTHRTIYLWRSRDE